MSSVYPPYNGNLTKPCPRCGVALSINERRCIHCGYYDVPASAQGNSGMYNNGQFAQSSWGPMPPAMPLASAQGQGSDQQQQQQWGQIPSTPPLQSGYGQMPFSIPSTPAPFGSGQMHPFNGYAPPAQPTANTGEGNYYGSSQQSVGNYNSSPAQQPFYPTAPGFAGYNNGQAQAMNGMNGVNGMPAFGNSQPTSAKRRPHVGRIVGMVVLLLVLVGGGIAGYTFLKANRLTTITGPSSTTSASNTTAPKGQPLFTDAFKDNAQQWNLVSDQGKFSAAIHNGSLILEDDNNKLLWEMVPGDKTFSNFNLYVDAILSKGEQNNGYGIYIRGAVSQNNDLTTYYRFELYGDGTFAIFKGAVDGSGKLTSTRIVDYTQSPIIQKQGGVNHIQIAAKGSTMTLLVNGQLLKTINDTSYSGGSVALFVSNLQGSQPIAQATFSHFAIYPPQS